MEGNKKLSFYGRLQRIMEHKGIESLNEMALKHLKYKSSQKLNRLKEEDNSPSTDILVDILAVWPEINGNWLITGSGEMLIDTREKDSGRSNKVEEPESVETSLKTIRKDLKKVLNHQVRARAEIRGFGEYQVMKDAKNDDRRRIAIMAQISKLIDANLEDDVIEGN